MMEQRKRETGLKLLCCCCYRVTFLFSSSVSVPCVVNQWEGKTKKEEKNSEGIMGIVVGFFPGGIFQCFNYIVLPDTWRFYLTTFSPSITPMLLLVVVSYLYDRYTLINLVLFSHCQSFYLNFLFSVLL